MVMMFGGGGFVGLPDRHRRRRAARVQLRVRRAASRSTSASPAAASSSMGGVYFSVTTEHRHHGDIEAARLHRLSSRPAAASPRWASSRSRSSCTSPSATRRRSRPGPQLLAGDATLTVSVHVLFFGGSISISMHKEFERARAREQRRSGATSGSCALARPTSTTRSINSFGGVMTSPTSGSSTAQVRSRQWGSEMASYSANRLDGAAERLRVERRHRHDVQVLACSSRRASSRATSPPRLAEFPDWAGTLADLPLSNLPRARSHLARHPAGSRVLQLFSADVGGPLRTYLPACPDPRRRVAGRRPSALARCGTPCSRPRHARHPVTATQDHSDHRSSARSPPGTSPTTWPRAGPVRARPRPTEFPAYADLVRNDAFGPIGFEGGADDTGGNGRGPARSSDEPPESRSTGRADSQPTGPSRTTSTTLAQRSGRAWALAILEFADFHQRGLAPLLPKHTATRRRRPQPSVPAFDFHQIVGLTMGLPPCSA